MKKLTAFFFLMLQRVFIKLTDGFNRFNRPKSTVAEQPSFFQNAIKQLQSTNVRRGLVASFNILLCDVFGIPVP